eukprot:267645_1
MVRMVARDIYGSSLCCDICGIDVHGTLLAYHCPSERTAAHRSGYDVCTDCVNKIWHIEEQEKETKDDDDPYTHLAQLTIDKMTLLFQLYPSVKDFGHAVDAMIGSKPSRSRSTKFEYNKVPPPPSKMNSSMITTNYTKDNDNKPLAVTTDDMPTKSTS